MASGLALSSIGTVWALYVGHGLLIGLLGNGAIYAPLIVYVSRWFDRRRGTAIALISSGQYVAGMIWPSLMEVGMEHYGWQAVMLGYAAVVSGNPAAAGCCCGKPPEPLRRRDRPAVAGASERVLGLHPNVAMALICVASFLCCIPMALPASHLVAFCGDLGIPPSHSAAMLSVLLTCAFISRQFWGAFADRFGGLRTDHGGIGSPDAGDRRILLTRNEAGLFAIAGALGLGFSGIIPAYSVTIRDLFPPRRRPGASPRCC